MAGTGFPLSEAEVENATARHSEGWSLPYSWMGDADLHRFEVGHIFGRSWHVVGMERDVMRSGQRVLTQIGNVPVVVVRGDDQVLRAFANVCRHRAYRVAEEDGCARTLVCGYHAWSYRLDGRLLGAPGADSGFDKESLSLRALQLYVWRGIVFVNADLASPSFEQTYPNLEAEAVGVDLDLRRYAFHSRLEMDVKCNWKIFYDNAIECYHCATIHRKTLSKRYDVKSFLDSKWSGRVRVGITELKGVDADGAPSHRAIQLYPGIVMLQDEVIGQLFRFEPSDVSSTRLVVDFFYNPDRDRTDADDLIQVWEDTLGEDKNVVARQQEGMMSGAVERGRLVAAREASVCGVQALILEDYRQALAERV